MTRPSIACLAMMLCASLIASTARAARPPTTAPVSFEFKPAAPLTQGQKASLFITVDVPEGLHAQSHTPSAPNYIPFNVTMDATPAVRFGELVFPAGEDHVYDALGKLNVYTGQVRVEVPFEVLPSAPAGPLKLSGKLQYQMCDDRVCYPPQRPKFSADTTIAGTPTTTSTAPAAAPVMTTASPRPMDAWAAFGMALIAGLLFNIMPCVLPVLPLKAAAFHRAAEHHRSRALLLGAAFSFGIIAVFAVLAVLVLVLRVIQWGSLFSNPIFIWSIVVLLVACAAGLFGAFTLQLPAALYNVDPRQDTIGGNIVFGAFTAIVATPCTAPLLPPLMLWASAQPAYVGVPAMLMVGVGMALPYFVLSATPELTKRFPRTGPFAELFKQMMGFLLLASAAYFAGGRLVHGPQFWWIVVAVVAIASLYLVARTVQLTPNARPVGIAATLAVLMLGATIWWTAGITSAAGDWSEYSDQRFEQLRESGKPVLVKFTANWCGTCQYIEGTVFHDPQVWKALRERDVTAMKVDFSDDSDAPGKELLLKLNPAGGIPLTALFFPQRKDPIVLASVYNSEELLRAIDRATSSQQASAR